MDFQMTDDRRMLADTLGRFLSDRYGPEARARVAYAAPYHDPDRWAELAELGVLYALAPEAQGGFGGAGFDIAAVFEPLGRALCPEPVLPALLAARLLGAAGADLEPLLSGGSHYAVALGEPEAPWGLDDIATEAVAQGDGFALSGRKSVVYGGQVAAHLLVAARHDGRLAVFQVAAAEAELRGYGLIDGGGAAEVILDATPATLVLADAGAALPSACDAAALALCAEAVGALGWIHAATADYLATRTQFGRTIGSFQALQHRMVDLAIEIEQARSITILAADRLDTDGGARAVSMAKSLVGRVARLASEEAVQLHGGIGMTWEYPVSHYAKRLVMIDHQFGDTDFHLDRVMAAYAPR